VSSSSRSRIAALRPEESLNSWFLDAAINH
jgi:hypothetical protein